MLREATINMKKEELRKNERVTEPSQKEFRKKAEKFFKQNEKNEKSRSYEIDFVCSGYELYKEQEYINWQTVSKKMNCSINMSKRIINFVQRVLKNCNYEKINETEFTEVVNNLESNYYQNHKRSQLSNPMLASIARIIVYK